MIGLVPLEKTPKSLFPLLPPSLSTLGTKEMLHEDTARGGHDYQAESSFQTPVLPAP